MRLVSLSSNRSTEFGPINFRPGLNVVLAQIRLPENQNRDSHNLGKTTLGGLLDFCLLAQRNKSHFLFKHSETFDDFVFLLEIEGPDGTHLTIRRAVADASKISFKRHSPGERPSATSPPAEWDHWELPFKRARTFLDGFLDLTAVSPWTFRKGLGYLLRTQRDYSRVFQLARYVNHSDWKPYVAHVLGLDSDAVQRIYEIEAALDELQADENHLVRQLGDPDLTQAKVNGLLLMKGDDVKERVALLDQFDFSQSDAADSNRIVSEIDVEVARLNKERYALDYTRRQLENAIRTESISFDVDAAADLFREVEIEFAGQLRRDFDELIEFNLAISEERRAYLVEELAQVVDEIEPVSERLAELNSRRAALLSSLGATDSFQRFRELSDEVIELKAEIIFLERQRQHLADIDSIRKRADLLRTDLREAQERLRINLDQASDPGSTGVFTSVRRVFTEIVRTVIDRRAMIRVEMNKANHPEFRAEILDEQGDSTSADEGVTYRKLLCVAFDLAVLSAHKTDRFPRFVFHDGIFEGLDPRKKALLMDVIEAKTAEGIQHIITTLDSDAPADRISREDVALLLHDQGEEGRLFRMPSW